MGTLKEYAQACGISLSQKQLQQFEAYEALLLKWNKTMNLTAITAHEDIAVKHFLDSLLPLTVLEIPPEACVLDVGSGAGFPGVVLKIARPDIQLTLLDSLKKRVDFLQELSALLGQNNLALHARAEEKARDPLLREHFAVVTARAVAPLPVLCEYCLPYVREGGVFAALKGWEIDEEAQAAHSALEALGGELIAVHRYELPGKHRRSLVVAKKISQTPPEYPRNANKITKKPL